VETFVEEHYTLEQIVPLTQGPHHGQAPKLVERAWQPSNIQSHPSNMHTLSYTHPSYSHPCL
jgi:hypothetical protein